MRNMRNDKRAKNKSENRVVHHRNLRMGQTLEQESESNQLSQNNVKRFNENHYEGQSTGSRKSMSLKSK